MTCAPISASIIVQTGPDRIRDRSTTNMSSSGRMARNDNELGWAFPHSAEPVADYPQHLHKFRHKRFRFMKPFGYSGPFPTSFGVASELHRKMLQMEVGG